MLIRDLDHQIKGNHLISFSVEGDLLKWKYRSSFWAITQEAFIKISSIDNLNLDNERLSWSYTDFVDNTSKNQIESLSSRYELKAENEQEIKTLLIYFKQLTKCGVNRNNSRQSKKSKEENQSKKDEKNTKNKTGQEANNSAKYKSSSKAKDSKVNTNNISGKENIYRAIKLLSQNLDADRKKKLKRTLRLIHHPDQGGSNEYYLAIEEAFEKLNY